LSVLRRESWPPYFVGAGIGILSWFAFWSADHPLGVSSVMVRAVAAVEKAVAPEHMAAIPYLKKLEPLFDWEFALVVGLLLGALLSRRLSGVPVALQGTPLRAIAGGFVMILGARLAGGCTSGHGISGSLQLAVSGWLFFLCIFVSGVAAAFLLHGKEGRDV
jgi:uncharacterized membrane protein YedE/YeeE